VSAKKRQSQTKKTDANDGKTTLKDLLSAETIVKLKEQSERMSEEAMQLVKEQRKKEEEERLAEQKRNENDFAYLLEHSKLDMRKD
jgi:hypothetical protein